MDRLNMDDLYYTMFLEETREQIERIEQDLLLLESGQGDTETINSIFRMAHSIKGASATMGIGKMAELSHHLESFLSKVRGKEIGIDTEVMNTFFESIDILKEIHRCVQQRIDYDGDIQRVIEIMQRVMLEHNKPPTPSVESSILEDHILDIEEVELRLEQREIELCQYIDPQYHIYKIMIIMEKSTKMKSVKAFLIINNLQGISDIIAAKPEDFEHMSDEGFGDVFQVVIATEKEYEDIYKNIDSISEIKQIHIKQFREGNKNKASLPDNVKIIDKSHSSRKEEKNTVRVDIGKIDKLLNLVGEFIIDKENLNQIGTMLKKKYKNDPLVHKLMDILPHINFIGSELQETVMSTRMMSLEYIFNRFPRMIRDLSQKCSKEVEFIIEGKDTEIDRGIIEELIDPLTHILRNAIDHGMEETEERKSKGKNPISRLRLSARHEESNVVITIEDDGRGIQLEKVKQKLIEKELVTQEKLKNLSDLDVLQFIFEPGFSTAQNISDVSGRGVGLDVVKSNIAKLNGVIDVKTSVGEGTRFVIKLPLTLAIIQALLIKEKNYIFAMPISSVLEILRLKNEEIKNRIHSIEDWELFQWREQAIPLVRIGKYFGIHHDTHDTKLFIVIVGYGERRVALGVDKLMGEQEIVIKSIGDFIGEHKLLGNLKGISGVSILGDGKFAQIIDIGVISRKLRGEKNG